MSQTIRRKATSVRKTAAAQGKKAKVSQAKARTGSVVDSAMAALPFTEAQLHRMFLILILGGCSGTKTCHPRKEQVGAEFLPHIYTDLRPAASRLVGRRGKCGV